MTILAFKSVSGGTLNAHFYKTEQSSIFIRFSGVSGVTGTHKKLASLKDALIQEHNQ